MKVLLTVGHCGPQGSGWNVYTNRSGTGCSSWCYQVGSVGSSTWVKDVGSVLYGGKYHGDLSFVNIVTGRSNSGIAYVANGDARPVSGTLKPYVGLTVCILGITTGRNCDFHVRGMGQSRQYVSGEIVRNVVYATGEGQCKLGGDSGGPVFRMSSSVTAIGILSGGGGGGGDSWGGYLDPCVTWWTSMYEASLAFRGSVKVS